MPKQQTPKIPTLGLALHILQNRWTTMKLQTCSGTLLEILSVDFSHSTKNSLVCKSSIFWKRLKALLGINKYFICKCSFLSYCKKLSQFEIQLVRGRFQKRVCRLIQYESDSIAWIVFTKTELSVMSGKQMDSQLPQPTFCGWQMLRNWPIENPKLLLFYQKKLAWTRPLWNSGWILIPIHLSLTLGNGWDGL